MIRAAMITAAVVAAGIAATQLPSLTGSAPPAARVVAHRAPLNPAPRAAVASPALAAKPLAGIRIALNAGHQLGNHNFPRQINRKVQAGGFTKACDTTGTATNRGYPEATENFVLAVQIKKRLEALGATVLMVRSRNSESLWGPCIDKRGEFGKKVGAVLEVSLHADGAPGQDYGFHVIAPKSRSPWTTDIAKPSLRLAKALRAGLDAQHLPRSTYIGGGTALSVRSDLGTLNMSDVPAAMIEIGNMRNAADAARMTSSRGLARYAAAVVGGIRKYLGK